MSRPAVKANTAAGINVILIAAQKTNIKKKSGLYRDLQKGRIIVVCSNNVGKENILRNINSFNVFSSMPGWISKPPGLPKIIITSSISEKSTAGLTRASKNKP